MKAQTPYALHSTTLHGQTELLLCLYRFDPDGFSTNAVLSDDLNLLVITFLILAEKQPAHNLIKQNNGRLLHWRAFKDLLITLRVFYDLVSQIIIS